MPVRRPLRYVDPLVPRGPVYRACAYLASTRFATWLARTGLWSAVVWRLDPALLRLSGGRVRTGLALPMALLQTRGARSGLRRSNPVIYFHDGERVIVVASKAGLPGNPAWFYNACANPEVTLGDELFLAEVVEDEVQRARLWSLADRVFPGFALYRRSAALAGREIPIVALAPRDVDAGLS